MSIGYFSEDNDWVFICLFDEWTIIDKAAEPSTVYQFVRGSRQYASAKIDAENPAD